jgi:hypothetical protein
MATARRGFLGQVTAAALGLTAGVPAVALARSATPWDDSWTARLGASHRFVFDLAELARLDTVLDQVGSLYDDYHESLGTSDSDMHVVIVIRHAAIPYAFGDRVWQKYAIGEERSVKDSAGAIASRNPGLAASRPTAVATALDSLQRRGGTLLACSIAYRGLTESIAEKHKADAQAVRDELLAGLLPGVTLQVNGVYARLRAQDAGCVLRTND